MPKPTFLLKSWSAELLVTKVLGYTISMLQADSFIVRVVGDGHAPDIDIFTDPGQGIAVSIEGIAIPHERNKVARGAREILQRTLSLFSLNTPKQVIHHTLELLKRELAEHFGKQAKEGSAVGAHSAVIKFAWDEENSRVVAIADTQGGFKNYGFRAGKLCSLRGEAPIKTGDMLLQCSPSVNTNLDWEVMQEILNFRNSHNLSLEQVRQLLIESTYHNVEKFRHTPLYEPRDMSVVLMEFDPVRAAREGDDRLAFASGRSASGPSFEKPSVQSPEFDFSDLLLPEGSSQQEALLTLQKVRNRLVSLGYEGKVKPHHYGDLPKHGDLQKVVKRAHDILEAEELREYLQKI